MGSHHKGSSRITCSSRMGKTKMTKMTRKKAAGDQSLRGSLERRGNGKTGFFVDSYRTISGGCHISDGELQKVIILVQKKKKSMNLDLKKEYHKGSVGAPWLLQFSGNLQCFWI